MWSKVKIHEILKGIAEFDMIYRKLSGEQEETEDVECL